MQIRSSESSKLVSVWLWLITGYFDGFIELKKCALDSSFYIRLLVFQDFVIDDG